MLRPAAVLLLASTAVLPLPPKPPVKTELLRNDKPTPAQRVVPGLF